MAQYDVIIIGSGPGGYEQPSSKGAKRLAALA